MKAMILAKLVIVLVYLIILQLITYEDLCDLNMVTWGDFLMQIVTARMEIISTCMRTDLQHYIKGK